MDSTIAAKETQLQTQMQAQLAVERTNLEKLGISQAEVDGRLKAYQEQIGIQYTRQLSNFRQASEVELAAKETEIDKQKQQSRQLLAQADEQRQQLISEAQTREVQLRSQFESERQQLQAQASQAQQQATQEQAAVNLAQSQLQALSARAQTEQLVSDQVVGSYNTILQDIRQTKFTQAETDMDSLRALLVSPKVEAIPEFEKRRTIDLALLGTLSDLIKSRTVPSSEGQTVDPAVALAANELVASQALVAKADDARSKGDADTAKSLYTQALTQLPEINKAFAVLQGDDAESTKKLLAQRDSLIRGLQEDSAKKAGEADQENQVISQLQDRLSSAQSRLADLDKQLADENRKADASVANLSNQQAQLVAQLKDQLTAAQGRSADLQNQLADERRKTGNSEASLSDLQNQIDQQNRLISQLQGQLGASQARSDDLQEQLFDARGVSIASGSSIASLRSRIDQQISLISLLKDQLGAAEIRTIDLQSQLVDDRTRPSSPEAPILPQQNGH